MSSITIWERISLFPRLLPLPIVLVYASVLSFFSKAYKNRKLYRIAFDAAGRYVTGAASVRQLQWVSGSPVAVYEGWAKKHGITPVVERIDTGEGQGVNVYWVGKREAERALIYIHGGGFMLPISDFMFTFWNLVQRRIGERTNGKQMAIAVLDYSLHPATFPTQLAELIHTINHCLINGSSRRLLSDIHLAGDSCGANIILQLISHAIHPIPGVPPSPIALETPTPLRSALLVSPWTSLDEQTPSQTTNNADALDARTLRQWGSMYVSGIPSSLVSSDLSYTPYVKIHHAPEDWLNGMERLVQRILITTGTAECLLDDAILLHGRLARSGVDIKMDTQEQGVHDDPIFDIGAGSKQLNEVGERIVEWLVESL